jgi:hypothetical protein
MKNEEAVSTVIAMMLILAIIATAIAIYSATYLPGLKQQSEIEHSRDVANAFVRFGSDIDYVISHKKTARFSEPFSLGGGDVLLSPVRSSGLVTIEGQPLVNVTVTGAGKPLMTGNASLVDVSYVPSFTTWEPQGYRWEYGIVAVTKDDVAVPQLSRYNTMDDTQEDRSGFLERFVELDPSSGANPEITITVVNLTTSKGGKSFITGSGIATLEVNATVPPESSQDGVTEIIFENCTVGDGDKVYVMMGEYLGERCNEVVEAVGPENCDYENNPMNPTIHKLTFDPEGNPVTVTLRTVNVEVSVC